MSTRDEDFVTKLFVANTHTPILFFSSRGIVYKLKVWRLPLAAPQGRGKALVNILPLQQGERITSILPLPRTRPAWDGFDVILATTRGTIRRNKLSDFTQVNRNGKIAMKLEMRATASSVCRPARSTTTSCSPPPAAIASASRWRAASLQGPRLHGGARHLAGSRTTKVISLTHTAPFKATGEALACLKQSAAFRRAAIGEVVEELTREGGRRCAGRVHSRPWARG
jgi:DNA gyrase subunit A